MQVNKTISFYTLGCKLNFSETSSLSRMALESGFDIVPFQSGADVYVINTCSVTDQADKKCRRVVRQAMKHAPHAKIVVIGCYAQLKPQEIIEIPGVDLVLGAAEKFNLMHHLQQVSLSNIPTVIANEINHVHSFHHAYSFGERTRTFLKVQDGCDYNCSFCTIPLARGKSRSNTIEKVLQDVQEITHKEVSEIVLTGINLGDFGIQSSATKSETFFELIQALENTEIKRIRISSIEPNLLSSSIIKFVSTSSKFVPHFHIPLQSGSNKILRSMRRRYKKELFEERIIQIKQQMPHACIGVDVITGFPGESDEDFLETYAFLVELDISYLHVFTYSERDNTDAAALPNPVPQQIREERTAQLIHLHEKKKRFFYEQFINTERNVLWESDQQGDFLLGFTDNYLKVKTEYDPILINTITPVFLEEMSSDELLFHGKINHFQINEKII